MAADADLLRNHHGSSVPSLADEMLQQQAKATSGSSGGTKPSWADLDDTNNTSGSTSHHGIAANSLPTYPPGNHGTPAVSTSGTFDDHRQPMESETVRKDWEESEDEADIPALVPDAREPWDQSD